MEDFEIILLMWVLFVYIFGREKLWKIILKGFFLNVNEEMLFFLYRIGILLYFNENSLNEIIIFDILWFFEVFKLIIVYFMNKLDIELL